jgi:hypothetical protein
MQIRRTFPFLTRGFAAASVLSLVLFTPALRAQQPTSAAKSEQHLVSPTQLQQRVQADSAARKKNIATLSQFLSSPMAVKKMKSEHIDPAQVQDAIPNLSSAELAQLAARAAHAQQQFAAGTLSNNDLLLIILILVVVILIAVIH